MNGTRCAGPVTSGPASSDGATTGDHEWTRGTERLRWPNNGKAVKRYPKKEEATG